MGINGLFMKKWSSGYWTYSWSCCYRKMNGKDGSFPRSAFDLDHSMVPLDYLLTDRQTQPGSFILAFPTQSFEGLEDHFSILLLKTNSIIFDPENDSIRRLRSRNCPRYADNRWDVWLMILNSVSNQILKQQAHLKLVGHDRR